jgi:hypothetical protein
MHDMKPDIIHRRTLEIQVIGWLYYRTTENLSIVYNSSRSIHFAITIATKQPVLLVQPKKTASILPHPAPHKHEPAQHTRKEDHKTQYLVATNGTPKIKDELLEAADCGFRSDNRRRGDDFRDSFEDRGTRCHYAIASDRLVPVSTGLFPRS